MIEKHLVTIGITTYNSDIRFLDKAVRSAINQSYKNIEIIIYDDFSNNFQEIEDLINSFKDSRIILQRNKKNQGVSNSLNKIIEIANGKFFCWCPDDDYMDNNKIKKQIDTIKDMPDAISLCDHYQVMDFFNIKRKITHRFFLNFFDSYLYSIIFDRINGGALMIPLKILKKIKFDVTLKHVQDYDVWHKIFYKNKVIYLKEILFYSRKHSKQDSFTKFSQSKSEISNFYYSFLKKNLYQLLYSYGKRVYFLIYTSFIFRNIDKVQDFLSNKSTINRYMKNFFKLNIYFYFSLYSFKLIGHLLKLIKNMKNFILYKVVYRR